MFSVITNIYNKETKAPPFTDAMIRAFRHVWQELEYCIDVCRVTRGTHIENL
jgi:hypothetical protein